MTDTNVRTIDIDTSDLPPSPTEPPPADDTTETPQSDPEAPWGRRKDGKPRAKPGRRSTGRKRPPRKRTTSTAGAKPKTKNYRNAVASLIQQIITPLAIVGTRDPRFMADAVVITENADDICTAVNDVAQANPALAKVLDTVEKIGPYGHLSQLAITIGVQIAGNHDLIPAAMRSVVGVRSVDDILSSLPDDPAAAAA